MSTELERLMHTTDELATNDALFLIERRIRFAIYTQSIKHCHYCQLLPAAPSPPLHHVKIRSKSCWYSWLSCSHGKVIWVPYHSIDGGVYISLIYALINHWSMWRVAGPAVTFPALEQCCRVTGTKLYCLVTEWVNNLPKEGTTDIKYSI